MIVDGDVFLVIIGCKYSGCCSDITRTYPANGSFSPRQREIYDLGLKVKNECASQMVPNQQSLSQMTTIARNIFKASPLRAMKGGAERTMDVFFTHGLSHYIGKQVQGQDLPYTLCEPALTGRIFTIKPGIYIESEGFGIRLGDCYIMTDSGAKNIFPNTTIDPDKIEAIMAENYLKN